MMRSSDLVPVLVKSRPAGVAVKIAEVNAWNTTTGANTLIIDAAVETNVPVVGALTGITAGDSVLVLAVERRWYVLGKFTQP